VDYVSHRLAVAQRALAALTSLLSGGLSDDVRRDAAIQRFEFSVEAAWKAGQEWLRRSVGVDVASPKSTIRRLGVELELGDDVIDALLASIDDRNLTVHTYNERTAADVAERLPAHAAALSQLLAVLSSRETA
jgi:nucleotidyltransferase substrate binding protein (TIGR01987 family)